MFGYTLNVMTMLALSLVVGILVDDAIVEVENIVRHLRNGKGPIQAAEEAVQEIGLAVVATSATLCAVFLPVAFMPGIPGKFFKQFAVATVTAVLASLLVARLLTPMMAAHLMKAHPDPETDGPLKLWYLRAVQLCLAQSLEDARRSRRRSSFFRSRSCRSCRRASCRRATTASRSCSSSWRRAPTLRETTDVAEAGAQAADAVPGCRARATRRSAPAAATAFRRAPAPFARRR